MRSVLFSNECFSRKKWCLECKNSLQFNIVLLRIVFFFFSEKFDYIVFLKAGDSLKVKSSNAFAQIAGSVRQIADINGNLINP